jgi:hypothetical protein
MASAVPLRHGLQAALAAGAPMFREVALFVAPASRRRFFSITTGRKNAGEPPAPQQQTPFNPATETNGPLQAQPSKAADNPGTFPIPA